MRHVESERHLRRTRLLSSDAARELNARKAAEAKADKELTARQAAEAQNAALQDEMTRLREELVRLQNAKAWCRFDTHDNC